MKNRKFRNFENRVVGELGALDYLIRVRRVKLVAISREEIDFEHFLTKKIIDANSYVEKEYLVRVSGNLKKNGLQLLNYGLKLDDKLLKKAKVSWINDNQLKFILTEGKKRQIRRMCEALGHRVIRLKRIRIMSLDLDTPPGKWRSLTDKEVNKLRGV